uniref:Reverse transcriptase domain-containing protein n=1 Tax=Dendroctonus ponderosae TaxID=77166 RepID=A0AAR5NZF5_DENPD
MRRSPTFSRRATRPISLLSVLYDLLTKIITNQLDFYQPLEQAGFRKEYSTIYLIQEGTEHNVPLHLTFVYYQKAFNSVEDKTERILIKSGFRQGGTISQKLLTLALQDVFKNLTWQKRGINIDGRFLTHLRFPDDIVLVSGDADELELVLLLRELKEA